MFSNQRVQPGHPLDPLGQPPAGKDPPLLVDQLDVVVVLGPVIPDEHRPLHLLLSWLHLAQRGGGQPAI